MTKSRKERRAEAVGRLSKTMAYGYLDDFVIIEALIEGAGLNHADMSMREDAKAIIDLLSEDECEMVDMWEREDADGCIWQDGWQCTSCGAMVNGIMPEPSTMLPPKFCSNCGAKARKGFGDGEKSPGETENGAGDGDVRMGDAVRERRDGHTDARDHEHEGLTDTYEKLERDVRQWCIEKNDGCKDIYNVYISWLYRQSAITAEACRDAWQIYRKSIEREIGDLQREVDHMRDATADMVEELWHDLAMWRDRSEDMRMELADAESFAERVEGCVTKGEPVTLFGVDYIPERKPIVGKDGVLIARGDVVYGEDGVRFEVDGLLKGKEHCVMGMLPNGCCKALRPEWLTHECPDTMGMIRDDLLMSSRNYCERHGLMPKTENRMTFDVDKAKCLMLAHIADRVREMA